MSDTAGKSTARRSVTRRIFLRASGGVLAGGLLLARRWSPAAANPAPVPLGTSFVAFATHQGNHFQILPDGAAPLDVRLSAVTAASFRVQQLPNGAHSGRLPHRGEHFTLVFDGPLGRPLPQGSYRFQHPRFEDFSLFIAPTAPTKSARKYVAVVNRPVF